MVQCSCIDILKHIRGVQESFPLVLLSIVGVACIKTCAGQHPGSLKLQSKKLRLNSSAQVLKIVKLKLKPTKSAWLAVAWLE